jgi:hypothetical protein
MNPNFQAPLRWGMCWAAVCLTACQTLADGIPEPSLVLYGVVRNTSDNSRLTVGTLEWTFQPTQGGTPIVVSAKLQNVNDQFSFVLQVPCETPIVGSSASPNTLQLTAAGITYDRAQMKLDGQPVALADPAQGTLVLAATDRGRLDRIDLKISLTPADSDGNGLPDNWETAYFNHIGVSPTADADQDGMSNLAEYKAGTVPTDAQSVFEFIDIQVEATGGARVKWSSVANKNYTIQRSVELLSGFAAIKTGVAATPPTNTYLDTTATGPGPYFYRLLVEP